MESKYRHYESLKARLPKDLDHEQYQRVVRLLALALGI